MVCLQATFSAIAGLTGSCPCPAPPARCATLTPTSPDLRCAACLERAALGRALAMLPSVPAHLAMEHRTCSATSGRTSSRPFSAQPGSNVSITPATPVSSATSHFAYQLLAIHLHPHYLIEVNIIHALESIPVVAGEYVYSEILFLDE